MLARSGRPRILLYKWAWRSDRFAIQPIPGVEQTLTFVTPCYAPATSSAVLICYNFSVAGKPIKKIAERVCTMFKKFFSWFKKPMPNALYAEKRNQLFRLDPEKVGIKRSKEYPNVWGVMTEFTVDGGYVTIVSLANGKTDMYFSSGSGIMGAGDNSMVSIASAELVKTAERYLSQMRSTVDHPFPSPGYTRFYLLTYHGLLTGEVSENIMLDERTHPMYGLYAFTQNVITQIRHISSRAN